MTDNEKMVAYICRKIPLWETTRIELTARPDAIIADLTPLPDGFGGCELEIDSNCPEWVTLYEVYDHFRRPDMTKFEWEQYLFFERHKRLRKSSPTSLLPDWCHAESEPVPQHFPFGPLVGNQKELSKWISHDGKADPRHRLHAKARSEVVFVRKITGQRYEVWFRSQQEFANSRSKADIGDSTAEQSYKK